MNPTSLPDLFTERVVVVVIAVVVVVVVVVVVMFGNDLRKIKRE